jgi:hypothetical protein
VTVKAKAGMEVDIARGYKQLSADLDRKIYQGTA